jgi:hypothetical protein
MINGALVPLERYQTPGDQGAVDEGPHSDVIPTLRQPPSTRKVIRWVRIGLDS